MAKKLTQKQKDFWDYFQGKRVVPPHIRKQYKRIIKMRKMPWVGKPWSEALKIMTKKHMM